MDLMTQLIVSFILSAALSVVAYKLRMLTLSGAIASFFVGYIVGLFGSVEWLILLVAFTLVGLTVTKIQMEGKEDLEDGGIRTHMNVLGVGIPACIFAVLYGVLHAQIGSEYDLALTVAFVSTMTVAAADTVASEIGIRDKRVWLITTFERVRRGTDGGVSVLGTLSALVASAVTAVIGWLLIFGTIDIYVLIPFAMGFLGCVIDSLMGATIEKKGWMSKYSNNCISAIIGALVGMAIVMFV